MAEGALRVRMWEESALSLVKNITKKSVSCYHPHSSAASFFHYLLGTVTMGWADEYLFLSLANRMIRLDKQNKSILRYVYLTNNVPNRKVFRKGVTD